MKRGFTLLELVVVVIILGILATLGIQQYTRMVERSRGAEARAILGQIRSAAAAYRLERGTLDGFNNTWAGIDTTEPYDPELIPGGCTRTHYFSYNVDSASGDTFTATATRCTNGGKTPNATSPLTLTLTTDFITGTDTWSGTGGY